MPRIWLFGTARLTESRRADRRRIRPSVDGLELRVVCDAAGSQYTMTLDPNADSSSTYTDPANPGPNDAANPGAPAPPAAAPWTPDNVKNLLQQSDTGKKTLDTLALDNVEVRSSDHIQSTRRLKNDDGTWGPWKTFDWGGMTETTADGKKIIHIPKGYTDAQAALILVHEANHATGGKEPDAYKAETQFVIESTDPKVKALARDGFIKTVDGKPTVDTDRIQKFVDDAYKGWYEGSTKTEYKKDDSGKMIIDYGNETVITGFKPAKATPVPAKPSE